MAHDRARDRLVVFGGAGSAILGDTWEHDGQRWLRRAPVSSPPPRRSATMVYDAARRVCVLFGGSGPGGALGDTWEWDGAAWTNRTGGVAPPARSGHGAAYDSVLRRTVVCGGEDRAAGQTFGDVWEWDGASWRQATFAAGYGARHGHAMAHDPIRQRVVLFGGRLANGALADGRTWEWDGATWTRAYHRTVPRWGDTYRMTFDAVRGRLVMIGDWPNGTMWAWDGVDWAQLAARTALGPWTGYALAFDAARGSLVAFAGHAQEADRSGLWRWSGAEWTEVDSGWATSVDDAAVAYWPSARRAVRCGGARGGATDEVWEWDGLRWTRAFEGYTSHFRRERHAAAHDPATDTILVFGGVDRAGGLLGDTKTWDGVQWVYRGPGPAQPPPRADHAMASDPRRQRVVLFGGAGTAGALGDTWEWDGARWLPQSPPTGPAPRSGHALAYDAGRGVTVLYGGTAGRDTWEWDGSLWQQRRPATTPRARTEHAMSYDPRRRRVVLFGGLDGAGVPRNDVYEWDGTDWRARAPANAPAARAGHVQWFDPVLGRTVVHAGRSPRLTDDAWTYGPTWPAAVGAYGHGCPGGRGTPTLTTNDALPWLGTALPLTLDAIPANTPAALVAGDSRSAWGGLRLPLDLTGFGMPGCVLWVAPQHAVAVPGTASGTSTVSVPVPAVAALLGVSFYAQGIVPSPGSGALGLVASGGVELVLGGS